MPIIKDGYKYYIVNQKRTHKDGSIVYYKNTIKVKYDPEKSKLQGKRGKDKVKRKEGSGIYIKRPKRRYTKDIYKDALKLNTEDQFLVLEYVRQLYENYD